MVWSTVNFNTLVELLVPTFLRKNKHILLLKTIITPLFTLHQQTLYEMQHDGRTIYLEKLLNEYFTVLGYDPNHHDLTKTIYIDDVVSAIVKALNYSGKENIFNIGTGIGTSLNELLIIIQSTLFSTSPINFIESRPSDNLINFLDVSKAKNILKWESNIDLIDGIKKTIELRLLT